MTTCTPYALGLTLMALMILNTSHALAFDGIRLIEHDDAPSSLHTPMIVKLSVSYLRQAPETRRRPTRGFGIGLEFARWFAETSYGSLLGFEINAGMQSLTERKTEDGKDGEAYGAFELHPRLVLGIIPVRPGVRSLSCYVLAGYMLAGWDDYWWHEDGVRQQLSLAARVSLSNQMIEYAQVRTTGHIDPPADVRDGFRRAEHRLSFRTMRGAEYGYAFTFQYIHGVVRALSLVEPIIDRQFMISAGFHLGVPN